MDKAPEVMTEDELVRALDQADADLARRQTDRLGLIAALDKTGYAERVGARDTVQFLEYRYRLDHYRARRDLQLARALPNYPAIAAQLADVKLRPAQAEAIVLELEKTPSTVPAADLDVAERELSRLTHLPPTQLRKATIQARDILDTDGPEPDETKAYARESLSLSSVERGVKFKGYLANENAELLRTLITTGARPHKTVDGAPDPRPRAKRQADALTTALTLAAVALDTGTPSPTLPRPTTPATTPTTPTTPPTTASTAASTAAGTATGREAGAAAGTAAGADAAGAAGATSTTSHAPASGTTPREPDRTAAARSAARGTGACGEVVPGFGAKANITVTIDLDDLKTATADAIGHTVYSNGLSAAAIRRLACDANVIPIVLGSRSEPLDVGRCERLVTKGIRRALNTRDRGCVVCGAPPVMCDAHHLTHWIDGGVTAVWNLALLCRRHHTDVHNGHWHITITNDTVHVTRPTWADPPPHPAPSPDTKSPPNPVGHPAMGNSSVDAPPERNGTTRPAAPETGADNRPDPNDTEHPTAHRPNADIRPEPNGARRPAAHEPGVEGRPERRTTIHRSLIEPPTEDEEALRAATYLAIWGEPLPSDDHNQPPSGEPDPRPCRPLERAHQPNPTRSAHPSLSRPLNPGSTADAPTHDLPARPTPPHILTDAPTDAPTDVRRAGVRVCSAHVCTRPAHMSPACGVRRAGVRVCSAHVCTRPAHMSPACGRAACGVRDYV
ncbi:DUF222 domain-containing protein [Kribbella sp. NPDC004536]|uniref:HNH endonuclease signature motif containing protein n=1 Tax=Kribbella sp. NPDC004536 TaxID=3364106 RepID=UPI0036781610